MNVIIYARYSSDLQNKRSVQDQIELCIKNLEKNEVLSSIYQDDAISGATIDNRPGIKQLLAEVKKGDVDIVMTESVDRLSRDIEHLAHIHKLCSFHGTKIRTLLEGDITELHVGFKGVASSLFLSDLKERIRRGQAGNIRNQKSAGGKAYGYQVKPLNAGGKHEAGLRQINPEEAEVVKAIYQKYVDGDSMSSIIKWLNESGIKSATGGLWSANSIKGHYDRRSGLLQNPIYKGLLCYNRVRYIMDPITNRRKVIPQPPSSWVVEYVPELQIVPDDIWDKAQKRREVEKLSIKRRSEQLQRIRCDIICNNCGHKIMHTDKTLYRCVGNHRYQICKKARKLQQKQILMAIHDAFTHEAGELAQSWRTILKASRQKKLADVRALTNVIEHGCSDQKVFHRLETLTRDVKYMSFDPKNIIQKYQLILDENKLEFINDVIKVITLDIQPNGVKIIDIKPKLYPDIKP